MKRNGIQPKEIRLVGGGARSAIWRQIIADIFNQSVVCLENEEAGAIGAAIQALWCTESTLNNRQIAIKDITDSYVSLNESSRNHPTEKTSSLYNDLYDKYNKLGECLRATYQRDVSGNHS
jgi:xylulokinase